MKRNKKGLKRVGIWLLLICMFVQTAFPITAAAATYKAVSDNESGIWVLKDGKKYTRISVRFSTVNTGIAVSGKDIYFTVSSASRRSNGNPYCYLYRKNMSTGEIFCLKELPGSFMGYDIDKIYSGSVYLTGWNPSSDTACYRYYISSKKLSKAVSAGYGGQYKNYIVCESTRTHGAFTLYPIYVYNTKTGKKTTVTKSAAAYTLSGKYLYYAYTGGNPYKGAVSYTVKRYNLTTGKTSTIASNIKAYFVEKVTSTYLYYSDYTHAKYYRCNLKTRKVTALSRSAYLKSIQ